jgi:signal transduction histidine kinase
VPTASSSAAGAGGCSRRVRYRPAISAQDPERKPRVAELLLDAARTLGDTLDHERVYDRFHELLEQVVPHDGVVVSSYDERDGLIRAEYCWTDGNRLDVSTFPPLPLNRKGGGMQSRVIVTGEPILVNDVAEVVKQPGGTYYDVDREGTFRKLPDAGPPPTQAAMMVPVKHEGRVVGVVQVMTSQAEFSAEQLEIMEGLVALMGAADRNARLHAERRRLEAAEQTARAVAAERERAASIMEAVGDGIFLVDPEGTIGFWNHAAALITGRSADEVCDRPATETFRDWESLAELIPVAEDGRAVGSTTLPVSVGDWDLWLSFVAVKGRWGVVYAFRDLTAERGLDEQKSDLLATISHELRTPMAAVYGAAKTLLSREGTLEQEKQRELLEMIAGQALRLSQITDEILLATQLDRGTLTIEARPVDAGELVRSTVDAMAIDADVTVEGPGRAIGSADRIQQVLVNLLDNALKYGRPPFAVSVEPAGEMTRILVSDAGPGIPFAEQRLVFERFYRSGPALTRSPGGTGLGLYISRELVQRMGGSLTLRSRPGAGSTFVVELPRVPS